MASLNSKKIEDRMAELKFSKVDVCRKANLSRTTFDGLLNGKDCKISTIVEVAEVLKSPIGYFFDEAVTAPTIVEAVNHSVAANGSISNVTIGDYKELESKVKYLEYLLSEKDKRIELQEKLISRLENN